jgi:cell fate (sporulation/competence/biofilm development) regulator YlbF (YheA/YmcA/DUF963 family)
MMAGNFYNAAHELEKAIRESDEYKLLMQSFAEVNADNTAKSMFDNFRQIQMNLQQKQMMGQEITQPEVEQAQKAVALVQQNPKIFRLMQAEQKMSMIIAELNQVIMKPLEEMYGTPQF